MDKLLAHIISLLREGDLTQTQLAQLIRKANDNVPDVAQHISKKKLLPFYLRTKADNPMLWRQWDVNDEIEQKLFELLRMKPRRTASGVATITVITKPWPCSSNCIYCPNDLRMPKSYLSNEPACQRAERNYFDPYLQVVARLRALEQMGHATDKVELIVLGGTFSDYPRAYQIWFVSRLFQALNEWPCSEEQLKSIELRYREAGIANGAKELALFAQSEQKRVNAGAESYNQGFANLYGESYPHQLMAQLQSATEDQLEKQHTANETAAHRVVGLVIETRPDTITPENLALFRRLGCTKVQIGVQSTNQAILDANKRHIEVEQIKRAFDLIRLYGFKIHAHLMLNLAGATPASDKEDFRTLTTADAFKPDEVKLYPCALVQGTQLVNLYCEGAWAPYTEEQLIDVLVHDTLQAPPFMRISRMIRDISACDIMVGNKKTNLRQMVEGSLRKAGQAKEVSEIRFREINRQDIDLTNLRLEEIRYQTTYTTEYFLQWATNTNRIAGFLRLSLPHWQRIAQEGLMSELAQKPDEAMIREVHVYGQAAHLGKSDAKAQHQGLGRKLIERACALAQSSGYRKLNVISSVGTREYYRHLGFSDNGLYQQKSLEL